MKKYQCEICMYIYDPKDHDNVAFETLPEDYVCPVCAVGKEYFTEMDE